MKKGSDDTTTAAPLMQYSLLDRRVSPSSWDRGRQAETSRNCEKKSLLILPCFCQSLFSQSWKEVITDDPALFLSIIYWSILKRSHHWRSCLVFVSQSSVNLDTKGTQRMWIYFYKVGNCVCEKCFDLKSTFK